MYFVVCFVVAGVASDGQGDEGMLVPHRRGPPHGAARQEDFSQHGRTGGHQGLIPTQIFLLIILLLLLLTEINNNNNNNNTDFFVKYTSRQEKLLDNNLANIDLLRTCESCVRLLNAVFVPFCIGERAHVRSPGGASSSGARGWRAPT